MLGGLDEAWLAANQAGERLYELTGQQRGKAVLAEIATLKGESEAAVDLLRRACASLEAAGNQAGLSTNAARLGRALCALDEYEEAERLAQRGRELGDERDFATEAMWRQAKARVHAHRGEHGKAEALARTAVEIVERTDVLNHQGDAFCDLSEVLGAAGRADEAAAALEQALERYGRKKNVAMVAQVRPKLEGLRARVP